MKKYLIPIVIFLSITSVVFLARSESIEEVKDIHTRPGGKIILKDADGSNYLTLQVPEEIGDNIALSFPNTAGTEGQVLATDGAGALTWAEAGGSSQWENNENGTDIGYSLGNVGIGLTNPTDKLDILGGVKIGANYAGIGDTAPENGLLVEGNVGVGTTAPVEALDVAGKIALNGYSALATLGDASTGEENILIGQSGNAEMTGTRNIFVGYQAGLANTTGPANIFVGYQAGENHTTGGSNIFIGTGAGLNNEAGAGNIFLAFGAGENETGSHKLYIGGTPLLFNGPLIYGDFDLGNVGINNTEPDAVLKLSPYSDFQTSNVMYQPSQGGILQDQPGGGAGYLKLIAGGEEESLNDLTRTGTFNGSAINYWYVTIDGTGDPDTFSWYDSVTGANEVPITGEPQELSDGFYIQFESTTGHTSGDIWYWAVREPYLLELSNSSNNNLLYCDVNGMFAVNDSSGNAYIGIDPLSDYAWIGTTGAGIAISGEFSGGVLQSSPDYRVNSSNIGKLVREASPTVYISAGSASITVTGSAGGGELRNGPYFGPNRSVARLIRRLDPTGTITIGSGNTEVSINSAYTLPIADGIPDQVLATDGAGRVSWADAGGGGGGTWGSITGILSDQEDLQNALNLKITNPMTAAGDIIYGGAEGASIALADGDEDQVLTTDGAGSLSWVDAAIWKPINYGDNWTAVYSVSKRWMNIAMSGSGQYQTAVAITNSQAPDYIYISSDYGQTWTAKDSARSWQGLAMSENGQHQTALDSGNGYIYVSSDYGETWESKGVQHYWGKVAMSSDGSIQIAAGNGTGYYYKSTDYGETWTQKSWINNWLDIAMSSSGQYVVVGTYNNYIYVSSDYGETWASMDSQREWQSVAVSGNGQYMSAGVNNGNIYVSSDYGQTWTPKESSRQWWGIAMSNSGKIQVAAAYGNYIYVSTNYGDTWTQKGSSKGWNDIAISNNGNIMTAVPLVDYIYSSQSDNYTYIQGNVGIDTTEPAQVLDVNGTAQMTGFKLTTSPSAGYVLTSDADGVGTWQEAAGDMSNPMSATGDIIYSSDGSGTPAALVAGDDGQVLTLASGVPSWATPTTGTVTGSGDDNYITKWTTGGTVLGNSLIYDDDTYVGIGTTAPAATLDVSQETLDSAVLNLQSQTDIGMGLPNPKYTTYQNEVMTHDGGEGNPPVSATLHTATMQSYSVNMIEARVVATGVSSTECASFIVKGTYKKIGESAPVIVGALDKLVNRDNVNVDCTMEIDGNNIVVTVTGDDTLYVWHATIIEQSLYWGGMS